MKNTVASIAAALLLAACAAPFGAADIAPGTPRDAVIARIGPPTRVVPLAGGAQRLQYSGQPAGQYAWMVDVDAAGRVTGARQVLNERDFNRIVPGQWTRGDVEREFGPPARIDGVASWNGPVLTYRWRDLQGANMFYWVYLDPQGVVRRAHPGMEVRDKFFGWGF
jgi:ABC-type transport system substrate-binding protein